MGCGGSKSTQTQASQQLASQSPPPSQQSIPSSHSNCTCAECIKKRAAAAPGTATQRPGGESVASPPMSKPDGAEPSKLAPGASPRDAVEVDSAWLEKRQVDRRRVQFSAHALAYELSLTTTAASFRRENWRENRRSEDGSKRRGGSGLRLRPKKAGANRRS